MFSLGMHLACYSNLRDRALSKTLVHVFAQTMGLSLSCQTRGRLSAEQHRAGVSRNYRGMRQLRRLNDNM